jgi:hypothetical protein
MRYTFLTSDDLEAAIKEDMLQQLARDDQALIATNVAAAISRMKDYLRQRYDVAAVFPEIGDWAPGNTYAPAAPQLITIDGSEVSYTPPFELNIGGRITNYAWRNGTYYEAIAESLAVEPGNDTANAAWPDFWRERDPRDEKVVSFATDIALFMLHKRVAARKIPQIRVDLYNQANEWLTLVRDGILTPDLPRPVQPADNSDTIRWGSNPQRSHHW